MFFSRAYGELAKHQPTRRGSNSSHTRMAVKREDRQVVSRAAPAVSASGPRKLTDLATVGNQDLPQLHDAGVGTDAPQRGALLRGRLIEDLLVAVAGDGPVEKRFRRHCGQLALGRAVGEGSGRAKLGGAEKLCRQGVSMGVCSSKESSTRQEKLETRENQEKGRGEEEQWEGEGGEASR